MVTGEKEAKAALRRLDVELAELGSILEENDPVKLVSRSETSMDLISQELDTLFQYLETEGKVAIAKDVDLRDLIFGGDTLIVSLFGPCGPGRLALDLRGNEVDERVWLVDQSKTGALTRRWSALQG